MKTKPKTNPIGGKQSAADSILEGIKKIDSEETKNPQRDYRRDNALVRLRWYICGTLEVLMKDVRDHHVAALIIKMSRDDHWYYKNLPGIGYITRESLLNWAKEVLK